MAVYDTLLELYLRSEDVDASEWVAVVKLMFIRSANTAQVKERQAKTMRLLKDCNGKVSEHREPSSHS